MARQQTAVSMIVANTWTYNYKYKSSSQLKKIEETKTRYLQVRRLRKNNPIPDCNIINVNRDRD